ncbi:MAG: hypothetical protein ACOYK7_07710, partial [Pirellulales bacterium]
MHALVSRVSAVTMSLVLVAGLSFVRPLYAQDLLYVADQGTQDVTRYTLPSTTGTVFGSGANPEIFGLTTGSAGQLYSVNNTGDLVRRFAADGTLAAGFGTGGEVDIKTLTANTAYGPVGVAFSAAAGGQLVVSAYNSLSLIRLNPDTGAWDTGFGTGGVLATTSNPLGVAFNATGNYIYYTQDDNTVWRVGADGTGAIALDLGASPPVQAWSLGMVTDTELFIADYGAG